MHADRTMRGARAGCSRAGRRGASAVELLLVVGMMCVVALAAFKKYGRALRCKVEAQGDTVHRLDAQVVPDACDDGEGEPMRRAGRQLPVASKPKPGPPPVDAAVGEPRDPATCVDEACEPPANPCLEGDSGAFAWTKALVGAAMMQLVTGTVVAVTPPKWAPEPVVETDDAKRVVGITTGTHFGEPKTMRIEERDTDGSPKKITIAGSSTLTMTRIAEYNWKISGKGREDSYFNGTVWMDRSGLVMKHRLGNRVTRFTPDSGREETVYFDDKWTRSKTQTWDNQGQLTQIRFMRNEVGSAASHTRTFGWDAEGRLSSVSESPGLSGYTSRNGDHWVDGNDPKKKYAGDYALTPLALVFQSAPNEKGAVWWRAQPHDQPLSKGKWAEMTPRATQALDAFREKAVASRLLPKNASREDAFALAMSTADAYADAADKLGDAVASALQQAGGNADQAGAQALTDLDQVPKVIRISAATFRRHLDQGNLEQVLVELGQQQTVKTYNDAIKTIKEARPSLGLQIFNHVADELTSLPKKTLEEFRDSPWKMAGTVTLTVLAPEFRLLDVVKKVTTVAALSQAAGKTALGIYYLSTGDRDRGAKLVASGATDVVDEVLQDKVFDTPTMSHLGSRRPCAK